MNAKIVRRIFETALLIAFTIVPALRARAWNNVGHRVVAELAWRQLNSKERGAISDLLKQHPHYKQYLIIDVPEGVDTNEWAFLKAAIWPDWIRGSRHGKTDMKRIPEYDLYPHALGLPFLRAGDTNVALVKNFHIDHPTAAEVLSNSMVELRNPDLPSRERSVSLCWTLHLMGDLHEPLHCASMVSDNHPTWDGLGGNYKVLDPRNNNAETDLHRFWDGVIGVESSYENFARLADQISSNPDCKATTMPDYRRDKTPYSWVEEGLRIVENFAYAPERLHYAHVEDLRSGKISKSQIPALKADYIREAEKIAQRRVALAGQRLADELKRDF
jgi:hypothetical protein